MSTKQAIESEIFVVSDLHIGGRYGSNRNDRGFRINTHVDELANFVFEVGERAQTTARRTELVINGDFVDFLAEDIHSDQQWQAFITDETMAVETFDTIVDRDKIVFEALRSAVQSGVRLTLLIGNHDVELSLPAVRAHLFKAIGGQCQFLYDGEAHVIGDVLIEHGNRYDGFNVIDHDRLRRHRSIRSRRLPLRRDAEFQPPPGSQLVEQVMNPIKIDYPFIDLLKPETGAVIPLIIALEPGFARDIERIWNLYRLSGEAKERAPSAPAWPARSGDIRASGEIRNQAGGLRELLVEHMGKDELDRLITLVEQVDNDSISAAQQIGFRDNARQTWSLMKLAVSGSWEKRQPVLLDALRHLQNDISFNRSLESEEYLTHAKELASTGFRVIVFGHSHLAKEVSLGHGATYLNTGTWADLMRVPKEILSASHDSAIAHLEQFVDAMKAGDFRAYVEFIPTFAHIELDQEERAVTAKLIDFEIGKLSRL
jgi:UDP-2,3-diacylglucosamine pyrophosphatase LpxH